MTNPRVADLAQGFFEDANENLKEALEKAYWRGHEHRELTPTEKEHEALLNVLDYARSIEVRGDTDWEARHLVKAIESYDVARCTTPSGLRGQHGAYVRVVDGKTLCSFCRVEVDFGATQPSGMGEKP